MKKIYSIWVTLLFVATFFLLLPLYYIFLQNEKWHRFAHSLTKFWSVVIIKCAFIRVERVYEEKIDPKKIYIYTPNHFSYFDIPIMAYGTPGFYKFIGKKSLGEIPIFGYMFRKLYITVNRESKIDGYRTLLRGLETIDKHIGLVIFPEGGIRNKVPQMGDFKDGPFKMAIARHIPIVPVTIPFNWIFLPDGQWTVNPKKLKIVYHKAIDTSNMDESDLENLKGCCRNTIADQLKKDLQFENR